MRQLLCVVGVAAVLGCKERDEAPQTTELDQAVIMAHAEANDCAVLRPAIDDAQERVSAKAGGAYSAKAFEDLAAMRADAAKDATQWKLVTARAQKLAAAWSELNLKAAALERRVALSLGDAGVAGPGSDAQTVADDLQALAVDESRLWSDLDKLCPKLVPR